MMIPNTIIHGDSYEIVSSLKNNSLKWNLIVVDPIFTEKLSRIESLFTDLKEIIAENGSCFVFIDWKHLSDYQKIVERTTGWTMVNLVIWSRMSPGINNKSFKTGYEAILIFVADPKNYVYNKQFREIRGKQVLPYKNADGSPRGWFYDEDTKERVRWAETSNVWCYTRPTWSSKEITEHGMQKPLQLCDRVILSSTNEGDSVLDVFSGSGSFLVSAKRLNRNFLGVEKEDKWASLIQLRLADCYEL